MKSIRKKLTAILVTVALATLGLPLVAFADDPSPTTGTLTVSSDSKEFPGKNVSVVQMFELKDGSYALSAQFTNFFAGTDEYGCKDLEGNKLSAAAYNYVFSLMEDTEAIEEFATDAVAWAKANATTITTIQADGNGQAKFSDLPFGYYVVYPEKGSTDANRGTDAHLVNFVADTPLALKSVYPTVDKEITGGKTGKATDVAVGDSVSFKLTSKVPDTTEYESYTFNFIDELSEGLTYNGDVVITIGGQGAILGNDYSVVYNTETNILTISMLKIMSATAGADIVVTYSATLNSKAAVYVAGNKNTAYVEYSNGPSIDNKGKSKESETETYTFDFTIEKYTGTSTDLLHLEGAIFELRKGPAETDDVIPLGLETDGGKSTAAVYSYIKGGSSTKVTTPASGLVQIKGLAAGTYYLHETKAPDGYNALSGPIKIIIAPTYSQSTGELESVSVTYGGEEQNPLTEAVNRVIPVENKTGSLLPTTGGIGTIAFAVAGVALVVVGIWFATRRKKEQD